MHDMWILKSRFEYYFKSFSIVTNLGTTAGALVQNHFHQNGIYGRGLNIKYKDKTCLPYKDQTAVFQGTVIKLR